MKKRIIKAIPLSEDAADVLEKAAHDCDLTFSEYARLVLANAAGVSPLLVHLKRGQPPKPKKGKT